MKTENASYAHCFAKCGPLEKPHDLVKCQKKRSNPTAKLKNRKSEAMRHAKCIKFPLLCLPVKIRPSPSCPNHALCAQEKRSVFRLLGTILGCPALYKENPLRPELCPPKGEAEALSSEGFLFIMQDTPKPYLEGESRFCSPWFFSSWQAQG